jgi:hypothetical protein
MLTWGANDIGMEADTRYIKPGFAAVSAQISALGIRATSIATLRQFRVKHNTPSSDVTTVEYRVKINGVNTSMVVTLACNAADGSDLVNEADVFVGDLIEVVAIKALAISTGVLDVAITLEDF